MPTKPLTAKQEAFVNEYLKDLNATQAYLRAGYKCNVKSAEVSGCQLLRNPKITAALQERRKDLEQRHQIDQDRIIQELAKIAFADMRDFAEWGPGSVNLKESSELTAAQTACVSEVSQSDTQAGKSVKFKLHSKEKALELLGKHLGMWGEDRGKPETLTVIFEQHIIGEVNAGSGNE